MADGAGAATAQVMVYVANELQGVFSHISKALTEYQETGDLPDSVFEAEPAAAPTKRKRQKKDSGRAKRKPSAFNQYVKEQIAVLRARPQTDEEHNNNNNNCTFQILTSCTLEKRCFLFSCDRPAF